MTVRVRLGEVTCPSGELVIIDGGYLSVWSGDQSPAVIDPALLGAADPEDADDLRNAVDFEAVGPDAVAALRLLAQRNPQQSILDIPASSVETFPEAFEIFCNENGFDAVLRVIDRVPHRERVRRAVVATGVGEFRAFGLQGVAVGGLPTDRPLWIEARADNEQDAANGWWSEMTLQIAGGEPPVSSSTPVGVVLVDFARFAFADADALAAWEHDDPADGRADVVFWGRSQAEAARALDAPEITTPGDQGYGWTDLPLDEAVTRGRAVLDWVDTDGERKLMVDLRPHSHHWRVMREVRASETSSGTIDVGGARILFAMTGRGDGHFPVYADRDASGALVAVRVNVGYLG
jgi:hypothetical protein